MDKVSLRVLMEKQIYCWQQRLKEHYAFGNFQLKFSFKKDVEIGFCKCQISLYAWPAERFRLIGTWTIAVFHLLFCFEFFIKLSIALYLKCLWEDLFKYFFIYFLKLYYFIKNPFRHFLNSLSNFDNKNF